MGIVIRLCGGLVRNFVLTVIVCFLYLFLAQPVAAFSVENGVSSQHSVGNLVFVEKRAVVADDRASRFLFTETAIDGYGATLQQDAGVPTILTLDTLGNGTVTAQPTGGTYRYGETVTVTATAAPGSLFVGWQGDLQSPDEWWAAVWDYRVPINVGAGGYVRSDKPVEVDLNFGAFLTELGTDTAFDPNSLRLVEVNANAQIIDSSIPFQFDDPDNDGVGTLVFLMQDATAATQGRTYHLYFDVVGKGFTKPNFTDLVALTDNVMDQGQSSFRVVTSGGTYFYHKVGGGFSSLVDSDGNDWIDYRNNVGTAGGAYRGIPNMIYPEGEFHPGATGSTSTFVSDGPLKATIHTVTNDGKWEALWEFFPTTARMTLLKYDHAYWFLYEGTPGGSLQTNSDYMVRADGSQSLLSQSWQEDLAGEEWVYFSDPNRNRSLFLAHHVDDNVVDSYRPMSDSNGAMTVFGFGRQNTPTFGSRMTQQLASFTIGLIDELNYVPTAQRIYDGYKPLETAVGAPQRRGQHQSTILAEQPVVNVQMTSNRTLTAKFEAIPYALATAVSGNGQIDVMPAQDDFFYNDVVTVTAVADPGWAFVEWQGDASGTENPLAMTIDGNKSITAIFSQIPYTVDVSQSGAGSVLPTPDQDTYFYDDVILFTATPDPGWQFTGWSGDLTGTANPAQLIVLGDQQITAIFTQDIYTLTAVVDGAGTVTYSPEEEFYRYGDMVTLTATAAAGWTFIGWQGDVTESTNPLILPMNGTKSVTAHFAQNSYPLTLDTEGDGTVQALPQATTYPSGQQVSLTATPAVGWRFVGWQGDLTGGTNPMALTIDGPKQVIAVFAPIVYTLTVDAPVDGTVTWSPQQAGYRYGDKITFEAIPAANYLFAGWGGNLSGVQATATLTVTGDMRVSAQFVQKSYTIAVTQSSSKGTVAITPTKTTYASGETVTLVATPTAGYRFVRWQLTPSDGSTGTTATGNPLILMVDKSVTIVPEFAEIESTINQLFLPIIVNATTNN